MKPSTETLLRSLPWASHPLICNAPMAGSTNAELAAAVTRAGGLGFIGAGADFSPSSAGATQLSSQLTQARELLRIPPTDTKALPVGVGCLTMTSDASWISSFTQLITQHRPVAVWLFANANRSQHHDLIEALHRAGQEWDLKVVVQIGNLVSAKEAVEDGADILSVQGSDAGGHQFEAGASLLTLLPDVVDMLQEQFPGRDVPLLAAGGIMGGRGVAAALTLGASGAVMGTRFLATKESPVPDERKALLLRTQDGASSTVKSRIHDELQGRAAFWPAQYSGRAIISDAYNTAVAEKEKRTFQPPQTSPSITWAGTGIGQIRSIPSAASVVTDCRSQAQRILQNALF